MKTKIQILFILALSLATLQFWTGEIQAGLIDIPTSSSVQDIKNVSIKYNAWSGDAVAQVNTIGFSLLRIVKVILQGVLLIYVVYIGVQMIMSMGSDEKELSAAKRQIRYALLWLLFINIPGTLYNAFRKDTASDITIGTPIRNNNWTSTDITSDGSIIADVFNLWVTINDNIVAFLKIIIFGIAVFMFILAGIRILTSQGREERIKESKEKIVYGTLALIFVGIIEAWKRLAFGGVIADGFNLFQTLANLALFFAAPVALFFLTLAGYYYITSAWDEERIKKAKRIIVYIFFATIILLASYTFLLDIATLRIT
jgi:hypothetical protein